jgi:hypothetical protein
MQNASAACDTHEPGKPFCGDEPHGWHIRTTESAGHAADAAGAARYKPAKRHARPGGLDRAG